MATQTQKEIAMQQQAQYVEQAAAEQKRIAVQEMTARAGSNPRWSRPSSKWSSTRTRRRRR